MNLPIMLADTAGLSGNFTYIDWLIVFGYLILTTILGGVLAGKQENIKDFFLGGRKLPWYAVAGSSIATELSAITFVSVPYTVFRPGGNFGYLQLGIIGGLLARIIVATILVPAYYKREIYSPYDYMGNALGTKVRSMTTILFSFGGMLAQASRVYLTALILMLVLFEPLNALAEATPFSALTWAVIIIGVVSVGWTMMGGIATVVWTDLILFGIFVIGAIVALWTVVANVDAGLFAILQAGWQEGKFKFWDFNLSPTIEFTVWTAAIATTWGNVGAYGTDQLMAQRLFTCKDERAAKWAVMGSYFGIVITILVSLVGIGLWYYYQEFPLVGEALAAYEKNGDEIFPIFILSVVPTGLTGLIIAGIFAAAISSLDSILAALSQTSMSAFYLPLRERFLRSRGRSLATEGDPLDPIGSDQANPENIAEDRRNVQVSRGFVIFWGIILSVIAVGMDWAATHFDHLLGLALGMAGLVQGGLMAGFFLALFAKRLNIDGTGFMYAGPLGVLTVFAIQPFNQYGWAVNVCWAGGAVLLLVWLIVRSYEMREGIIDNSFILLRTLSLIIGISIMLWLAHNAHFEVIDPVSGEPVRQTLAWPWYAMSGSIMTFIFSFLLAGPRRENEDPGSAQIENPPLRETLPLIAAK